MNKQQLLVEIQHRTGLAPSICESVINASLEIVQDQLCQGDSVSIRGFGVLVPRVRAAKVGRDIRRDHNVHIPVRCVPYFKPGTELRAHVNQAYHQSNPNQMSYASYDTHTETETEG